MFALYVVYAALGFLALAAYGISLLQVGWATLIYSIVLLISLFIQGNVLPILHYLPGVLLGVLLLIHR